MEGPLTCESVPVGPAGDGILEAVPVHVPPHHAVVEPQFLVRGLLGDVVRLGVLPVPDVDDADGTVILEGHQEAVGLGDSREVKHVI